MKRAARIAVTIGFVGVGAGAPAALAGGAWTPAPGKGYVNLGFSRKAANSSWNAFGDSFTHLNSAGEEVWHDFRYGYVSGEVGVFRGFAVTFTTTWLHGLEGPKSDYESNKGFSETWIGAKYQFAHGTWPMAVAFTHRTPFLYDLPGPYNRHLFDTQGEFRGVSPEWRGLLKRDYSLSYLASRSLENYRGWTSLEAGYTWREGAPADQLFASAEVGLPLRFLRSNGKLAVQGQWTVGSASPRQPDDRFGSRADYNFNEASYAKLGASWIVPLGPHALWAAEIGFNRWINGRSARRYSEPYLSIGRRF